MTYPDPSLADEPSAPGLPGALQRLGGLTHSLYRAAHSEGLRSFDALLFSHLQDALPFDAAWIGHSTLTPTGPVMHSNVLHQLAPDYVTSWEAVQDLDPLVHQAIGQPGQPVVLRASDAGLQPAFVAFLRRFGIAQVLCTTSLDTTLQTCLHLSLYRGDTASGFDPAAADLVAAAMPNLASAVAMNRMRAVELLQLGHSTPRSGVAVTSAKGLIQHADPAFGDFMLSEWPQWRGGFLPVELLPGNEHATPQVFHGQRITVDTQAHGDLRIITARSTPRSDRLTPRERAVALQFAQGHSYKEVARTLNMAPSTVRHHLRQVYAKLAIQDKGAIAWALAQERP